MKRSVFLCAAATWAMCDAAAGLAAEAQQGTRAGGSAEVEHQATFPGEILVTARRREERLLDVPVAITAASEEKLVATGVRTGADLVRIAPTLSVGANSGRRDTIIFELRGISAGDTLLPQDPGVAVYVNEVVQTRPTGLQGALYDLESVQVLYGPQGTLFGRNSTAGAILFTSRKPEYGEMGGEWRATLGSYDRVDLLGIVNVSPNDKFAVRVAGNYKKVDGYTRELNSGKRSDNENSRALRGSVRIRPVEAFENTLIADFYRSSTNGSGAVLTAARACGTPDPSTLELTGITKTTGTASCLLGDQTLAAAVAAQQALGPRRFRSNVDPYSRQKVWGIADIATLELSDDLTIKNIFGYRKMELESNTDLDGSPLGVLATLLTLDAKQISNELQLEGRAFDGQLNYIVGGYYFRESGNDVAQSLSFSNNPAAASITEASAVNISKSVFTQGTFRPAGADAFSFTAGIRYTWDTRRIVAKHSTVAGNCRLVPVPADGCRWPLSKKFSSPSYNLTVDYKITPDTLVYLAHRHGYRSGGFNPRGNTAVTLIPFKPEKIDDYEAGLKSSFRSGELSGNISLAGYIAKYKNIQRTQSSVVDGVLATNVVNAASATIKGGEMSLMLSPVQGLEFTFDGSITDFQFDDFAYSLLDTRVNPPVPATFNLSVPGPNSKYTWGVSAQYRTALGNAGDIRMNINYKWRSKAEPGLAKPLSEAEGNVPAYGIANASIRLENVGGSQAYIGAFVDNLFDKVTPVTGLTIQQTVGVTTMLYHPPRMFGFEVGTRF